MSGSLYWITSWQNAKPDTLRVTLRHRAWDGWRDASPLRLDPACIQAILDSAGIQQFTLELETIEQNKDQLQDIVERLSYLQGNPRPGAQNHAQATMLELHGAPRWWQWTGPADLDGLIVKAHEGLDTLKYHIVEINWRAIPTDRTPVIPVFDPHLPHEFYRMQCCFGRRARSRQPLARPSDEWEGLNFPLEDRTLQRSVKQL